MRSAGCVMRSGCRRPCPLDRTHTATDPTPSRSPTCTCARAPARTVVVVLIHGGFWRGAVRPRPDDAAGRGPRRARARGVERRVPAAGQRTAAGRRPPRTSPRRSTSCATSSGTSRSPPSATRPAGTSRCCRPSRVPRDRRRRRAVSDLVEASRLGLGDGVVDDFAGGALGRGLADRARAARPCPVLLVHGTEDDTVPASHVRALRRARRRRDALAARGRGPHGAHRPAQRRVAGGGRVADDVTSRAHARGARRRRPARRLPRAVRRRRRRPDLRRRQLARAAAARDRRAARPRSSTSGASGSSSRLAGLDRAAARGRRPARRARPRRAARARSLVCDSVTVNLFKLAGAVLDARARPARRGSPTTSRPTATSSQGLAEQHGVELRLVDRDGLERGDARARALAVLSPRRLPLGRDPPVRRASTGLVLWDLSHAAGAIEIDLSGAAARRRLHLQVPQRRPRSARVPLRPRGPPGDAALADPGLVRPARAVRDGPGLRPRAGHRALPRRHAADPRARPRSRSRRRAHRRGGHGAIAAQDPRADRPLRRAARRVARAARASRSPSPRDAASRGGHVSLAHPEGWQICRALIERADVVPDFRAPGPSSASAFPALYTRFEDVFEAAKRTKDLVALGAHREIKAPPRPRDLTLALDEPGDPEAVEAHLAHDALAGDEVAPRAARQLHGRRVRARRCGARRSAARRRSSSARSRTRAGRASSTVAGARGWNAGVARRIRSSRR